MSNTGTATARLSTAPAGVNSDHRSFEPKAADSARVREGAYFFFWIATLLVLDAMFTVLSSHSHGFAGFGVGAMIDTLTQSRDHNGMMHLIANGWLAFGFVLLGYCAAEGHRWAFVAGMAALVVDGALLVVTGNYLGASFHGPLLYAIYLGFGALGQSSTSERSDLASAAHAG